MKSRLIHTTASLLLAVSPRCAGDEFRSIIKPFIAEHCASCHGAEKQKGKLRLDTLTADFSDPLVAEKWKEVVNAVSGHEMPPEDEPQPSVDSANRFASWLESELGRAEIAKRSTRVVLRRMNRAEYNNTIRDLVGVNFNPAERFPEDPPAGGFDNIGGALTMSPMQLELYYDTARQILDRALVEGAQPEAVKWRFDPEENDKGADRLRVKRGNNNILLNKGINKVENGFSVIHHESWNTPVGFRDFKVPVAGEYVIRFRAAGRVASRDQVVASAGKILGIRRDEQTAKQPDRKEHHDRQFESDLQHFKTHPIYNYGPPRVKMTVDLGGTPRVVSEMDVDADPSSPGIYEVRTWLTTETAGVSIQNNYDVPKVLENFWMQGRMSSHAPS
jgi:hypothetical protein